MMNIKKNVDSIYNDINQYSKHPERVTLVGVTKYVDVEVIKKLLNTGVENLGENKVQVLKEKYQLLLDYDIVPRWHFIGNLQRNKVKYIVPFVKLIHSVNSLSLALEIDKQAAKIKRVVDVLLEINIFGEENKKGFLYEGLFKEVPQLLKLENIRIKGVMAMAPNVEDKNYIREGFKKLRELKEFLNLEYFNGSLTELSIGMSGDYKIALEEGATLIRIGTNLFK